MRYKIVENNIEITRNICQEFISKNEKDQIEIAPGLEQPRPDVSGSGRWDGMGWDGMGMGMERRVFISGNVDMPVI